MAVTNESVASTDQQTTQVVTAGTMNPLHSYASYTYGISLHALTTEDYNGLVKKPGSFAPSLTLISSASKYKKNRAPSFQDDFYFEELKMETVIGLNSTTQGTNAIQISFTIIEPYGLTLLNRLLDVSISELSAKNYLDIPYLLEINFLGARDNGLMGLIPGQTKWIPIKILEMKIKAGVKGSEYQLTAVPYNHLAFTESVISTPVNFEITARTVGEFFGAVTTTSKQQTSTGGAVTPTSDASRSIPAAGTPAATTNARQTSAAAQVNNQTGTTPVEPTVIRARSYTAAYNAWHRQTTNNKAQEYATEMVFEIDPEIINSPIVYKKKNTARVVPIKDTKGDTKLKDQNPTQQAVTPGSGPDFERSLFNINVGDSIISIINKVMENSEYFINNIKDPTKDSSTVATDREKPIKHFKIIPKIELLKFDSIAGIWKKRITYQIKTYTFNNSKDSRANKSFPTSYAKEYNYIYTGKNTDIIDFEIDFNTLYYTAINSDLAKTEALNVCEIPGGENATNNKTDAQIQDTITPRVQLANSGCSGNSGQHKESDSSKIQAASVMQSFYSSPRGDMLNLKLKIIGDPHFIKQDDIYMNFENQTPGSIDPTTGSLIMDAGELYAYVRFRTPVDIDESTGLYKFGLTSTKTGKTVESYFSGYYRIQVVQSEFRGGKFTQTLDLIRMFNQPQDNIAVQQSTNNLNQRLADDSILDQNTNPAVVGKTSDTGIAVNTINIPTTMPEELTTRVATFPTTEKPVTENAALAKIAQSGTVQNISIG